MNQVASKDRRKVMQKHLGTGCKRYRETRARWQKVANAAAVEANYRSVSEGPRVVKTAFATVGLAVRPQETGGLIEVLYDSFAQPGLAGIRAAGMRVRQMLFRAEPYQIDIQIEAQPERNRLVVAGQLLDVSHLEIVGGHVLVSLSDGRGNSVNAVTNQFGEFRGEVENSGDLELSFLRRDGKPVVILVRETLSPSSRANK